MKGDTVVEASHLRNRKVCGILVPLSRFFCKPKTALKGNILKDARDKAKDHFEGNCQAEHVLKEQTFYIFTCLFAAACGIFGS